MAAAAARKRRRRGPPAAAAAAAAAARVDAVAGEVLAFVKTTRAWTACRAVNRAWRDAADREGLGRRRWVALHGDARRFTARLAAAPRLAASVRNLDLAQLQARLTLRDLAGILDALPRLRAIKLVKLPRNREDCELLFAKDLETLEVMETRDADILHPSLRIDTLKRLHLWQTWTLSQRNASVLRSMTCLTDFAISGVVNSSGFTFGPGSLPPALERFVLVHSAGEAMSSPDFLSGLASVAATIEHVNLSNSMRSLATKTDWCAPRLRVLILDDVALDRDFSRMLYDDVLPALQTLSAGRCASTGDEHFDALEERRAGLETRVFAPQLRLARLTGTRITEATVRRLERCPQFQLAVLDSCRELPRRIRTKYARLRNEPRMVALLADLELTSTMVSSSVV